MYAAGLCVARAYMRLVEVSTVVTVAGMTIRPGDILHADEHGILRIPTDALPDIAGKAQEIRDEEQAVIAWSRSPRFDLEGLLALRRVRH